MNHDDGEILMGCWDCSSCGARGLRGDSYQCKDCGAPRPDDVQFYLPKEEVVITDERGIADAEAGPDWQCAFCESWVPAAANHCINCRASRADSQRRQQTGEYQPEVVTARFVKPDRPSRPKSSKPFWILGGVLAVFLLAVAAYGINRSLRHRAFQAKVAEQRAVVDQAQQLARQVEQQHGPALQRLADTQRKTQAAKSESAAAQNKLANLQTAINDLDRAKNVEVAGHSWTVRIDVEKCVAKPGQGWDRPAGAFDVRSEQRVHHHEKVLDRVDTLHRTETYREQDGFITETYTERVASGTRRVQSGTTTKSLGNGRFKRTPKYRTETVYKNVTKTRQKPRMVTKTRQVPYQKKVYRDQPVMKPWYIYKTKLWAPAPQVSRSGQGREPQDPEDAPPKNAGDEVGARRIRQRTVAYALELKDVRDAAQRRTLEVDQKPWTAIEDGASMFLFRSQLLTAQQREERLSANRRELPGAAQYADLLKAKHKQLADQIPLLKLEIGPLEKEVDSLRASAKMEKKKLEQLIRAGY